MTERYTHAQLESFLVELAEFGNVREACRRAKLTRSKLYQWRENDEAFAKRWDEAYALGVAGLEDEARRRAAEGVDKPVFQQGEQVGKVREYSDGLLMFLLKGAKPDVYKERVSAEHSGPNGGPIEFSDTERSARIAAILDAARARGSGPAAVDGPVGAADGSADAGVSE